MAYIEDYDLAIGAVTLAQFGGMSNRPYTSYAQGRRVCGLAAGVSGAAIYALLKACLLYTSDAADD